MKRTVTINDVAKAAGVSVGTVSNVINGTGKFSEKTAAKVHEVIKDLNYVPNNIAKTLKTKKNPVIGIIAEDMSYYSTGIIIDGISSYFEDHCMAVSLCNLRMVNKVNHICSLEMYNKISTSEPFKSCVQTNLNLLLGSLVSGIIYIGVFPRDVTGILPALNIPVVYTFSYADNAFTVNYDDFQGAKLAVQNLVDNGHKSIAMISGPINSIPAHKRMMAYQQVLMENKLAYIPEYVRIGDWEYSDGYNQCKAILQLKDLPTAIFVSSDLMAYGAISAIKEAGLIPGKDISIQAFDNGPTSQFIQPALDTIDLPLETMGFESASLLHKQINEETIESNNILLPCSLVTRDSVTRI